MAHFLIIGCGGLGSALATQLVSANHQVSIAGRTKRIDECDFIPLDIQQEQSFESLFAQHAATPFDVVINTLGVLHDDTHAPEKSISQVDPEWFLKSMQVNCLTSMLAIKHLSKHMRRDHALKFIALSARVGSISDNRLGGWLSYRASKAALNMIIKTVSLEWKLKFPNACIIAYHPGTVDSALSKPFQGRVKNLFTTQQAANYLLELTHNLTPEHSGFLYDWQQQQVAF